MKYKIVENIVIVNKGKVNVIPEGTIVEQHDEEELKDILIDRMQKGSFNDDQIFAEEDEIQGKQTDVDDFDYYNGLIVSGPFSLSFGVDLEYLLKFVGGDINNLKSSIINAFNEFLLISNITIPNMIPHNESIDVDIIPATNDLSNVVVSGNLDRVESDPKMIHKGKFKF